MSKKLNIQIGKRIKELRKIRGYSQEQLAEKLDIAVNSLSCIETGNGFMTLSTLDKLSKILGVEPYEIFKFSTIESSEEMYDFILNKLNFIKNNDDKLRCVYSYFKNLV